MSDAAEVVKFRLPLLATWRAAVASKRGPRSPVTRHVLLTLALHMGEPGEFRYPSFELLAIRTGLSLRTVKQHIALAVSAGWIGKWMRRLPNGQGWRQVFYTLKIPARAAAMFHVEQGGADNCMLRPGEQLGGV